MNPKGLPLPGNERGGADLLVSAIDNTHAVDVCVCRKSNMGQNYNTKMRKYEDYCKETGQRCVPFIVSHNGSLHSQTLQVIKEWSDMAPNVGFVSDLVVYVQCAIVRAMKRGIALLHARQ